VVRWIYPAITSALWVAWFTYWMVSSRNTKDIARIESAGSRAKHLVPLIVGCVLFAGPPQLFPSWPWLSMRVLLQVSLSASGPESISAGTGAASSR
jgi:hypothetical protein